MFKYVFFFYLNLLAVGTELKFGRIYQNVALDTEKHVIVSF